MVVQYFDFTRYHGKKDVQGSTFIRMKQMEQHWPGFTPYKYGANPDVLIFQKVYCSEDYKFPAHFPGIKILDICDPDWLDGINIAETARAMDAVVAPTEALADYIRQFCDHVHVIPDRFDVEVIPSPKEHLVEAKSVVWFGYSHNATLMKQAMRVIDELNLDLIIISNDDPFLHQWSKRDYKRFYKFVRYDEDTFYQELQNADFAVLPPGFRPQDYFKSNNKTVKANLAGLPVATTVDEMKAYMKPENRRQWSNGNYQRVRSEYDIRKSVQQYQDIIKEIQNG